MWLAIWALPPHQALGIRAAHDIVRKDRVGATGWPDIFEADVPTRCLAHSPRSCPEDAGMTFTGSTIARLPAPFPVMMSF
jgi:hypothetical protein